MQILRQEISRVTIQGEMLMSYYLNSPAFQFGHLEGFISKFIFIIVNLFFSIPNMSQSVLNHALKRQKNCKHEVSPKFHNIHFFYRHDLLMWPI